MKAYQHTQRGTVILVAMAMASLIAAIVAVLVSPIGLVILLVCAVVGWLFSSLTIELTEDRLRWYFGPGVIRKEVPLAEITSAQPVRTNVLEGWGIHLTRHGWLYNVSGFDAVALHLNGRKRFALGTDEPGAFLAALRKSTRVGASPR